ncbi:MAG: hypothetical protein ACREBD_24620 [Blastocatellia bacterium]
MISEASKTGKVKVSREPSGRSSWRRQGGGVCGGEESTGNDGVVGNLKKVGAGDFVTAVRVGRLAGSFLFFPAVRVERLAAALIFNLEGSSFRNPVDKRGKITPGYHQGSAPELIGNWFTNVFAVCPPVSEASLQFEQVSRD